MAASLAGAGSCKLRPRGFQVKTTEASRRSRALRVRLLAARDPADLDGDGIITTSWGATMPIDRRGDLE